MFKFPQRPEQDRDAAGRHQDAERVVPSSSAAGGRNDNAHPLAAGHRRSENEHPIAVTVEPHFSMIARLYDFIRKSRRKAAASIRSVDSGMWKFVTSASAILNWYGER